MPRLPLVTERISFSSSLDMVGERSARPGSGGAYRDRTDDLMLAKQPLSQLS